MAHPSRVGIALASACIIGVACGGTNDVTIGDTSATSPAPGAGASNPPQGDAGVTDPTDAAAQQDRGGGGGSASASCPPLSATPDDGSRTAIARRSTKAKTLDGDFSDYDGCVSVAFDATNAARVKGTPQSKAAIMIEWDPSALWIAAQITDATLEGTDPVHPYMNDGLEIYVSSSTNRMGDFGPNDHQLVVDYKNLARAYPGETPPEPKASIKAVQVPGGYRVEMRVDAVFAFGARLAKGDVRFFDAMINDGAAQAQLLIWAMQPHASCSCQRCVCNRSPALDTQLWAPLTLE